jgi:hypothetical protein
MVMEGFDWVENGDYILMMAGVLAAVAFNEYTIGGILIAIGLVY